MFFMGEELFYCGSNHENRQIVLVKAPFAGFPKTGLPPNHPFLDGIFPYKPSIFGYPHDYGNPCMMKILNRNIVL